MQAKDAGDGKTFAKVQLALPPVECIGSGKTMKIADHRIVDSHLPVQIPWAPSFDGNLVTSLDQGHRIWKQIFSVHVLQVLPWLSRERGHETSYHRSQEGQESRVGQILSGMQSLAKGGLVGYRDQRVDVDEVVVDEQLQKIEGTY